MPGCRKVYINGRFLSQGHGGVQRFAREIVSALDETIASSAWARSKRWVILTPPGVADQPALKAIKVKECGLFDGHLWEQTSLALGAHDGLLLDLGNAGPVLHPQHVAVIHDATVFRYPENFGRRYGALHRFLSRALARRARICTVSEFSRSEICEIFGLSPQSISIIPNAAGHLQGSPGSASVLARLGLDAQKYFLFVGSTTRNKNLRTAIEAFRQLERDGVKLVLVGGSNASVFGDNALASCPGVITAGHLPDAEVAELYRFATALVFPSIYEGFGIPPLEAMVNDCPVIASAIPPVQEVCGDAAQYFSPMAAEELASIMRERIDRPQDRQAWVDRGRERSLRFSWTESANRLVSALHEMDTIAYAGGGDRLGGGARRPARLLETAYSARHPDEDLASQASPKSVSGFAVRTRSKLLIESLSHRIR